MVEPRSEEVAERVAEALNARGVEAERLEPDDYKDFPPLVVGGEGLTQVWFRLPSDDVDILHVIGSVAEDSHLARYMVTEIPASRDYFAEFKPKRKGLLGLGGVAGFEWKGRGLAEELNKDPFLRDMIATLGHTDVSVWPETQNAIAIHPVKPMQARELATFLRVANAIAKHARRFAR